MVWTLEALCLVFEHERFPETQQSYNTQPQNNINVSKSQTSGIDLNNIHVPDMIIYKWYSPLSPYDRFSTSETAESSNKASQLFHGG